MIFHKDRESRPVPAALVVISSCFVCTVLVAVSPFILKALAAL